MGMPCFKVWKNVGNCISFMSFPPTTPLTTCCNTNSYPCMKKQFHFWHGYNPWSWTIPLFSTFLKFFYIFMTIMFLEWIPFRCMEFIFLFTFKVNFALHNVHTSIITNLQFQPKVILLPIQLEFFVLSHMTISFLFMKLTHQKNETKHVHQFQMIMKENLMGFFCTWKINQIHEWHINFNGLTIRSIGNAIEPCNIIGWSHITKKNWSIISKVGRRQKSFMYFHLRQHKKWCHLLEP